MAAQYTVKQALAQGFNITYGDGGVPPVTYSLNDNWDPQTNGIGDPATFTPTFTVAPDGSGDQPNLTAAFNAANALGACGRVYIRLLAGEHRAIATLASKTSGPAVTVYSTDSDASKTVIVMNNATATVGSMSNSATLTIKAIRGFQMKNVTVSNDYVEGSATGNQSAVAMLLQSDQSQFENVRFLGNIATLYVKSASESVAARSYFRDCYIEGDQDFIMGRGTAVFDHCEIKYLTARQATGGSIGYPSTLVFNRYGFLFDSCKFTADTGATGIALGRQWVEQGDTTATNGWAVGKMVGAQLDAGRAPGRRRALVLDGRAHDDAEGSGRHHAGLALHVGRLFPGRRRARPRPNRSSRNTGTRARARTSSGPRRLGRGGVRERKRFHAPGVSHRDGARRLFPHTPIREAPNVEPNAALLRASPGLRRRELRR